MEEDWLPVSSYWTHTCVRVQRGWRRARAGSVYWTITGKTENRLLWVIVSVTVCVCVLSAEYCSTVHCHRAPLFLVRRLPAKKWSIVGMSPSGFCPQSGSESFNTEYFSIQSAKLIFLFYYIVQLCRVLWVHLRLFFSTWYRNTILLLWQSFSKSLFKCTKTSQTCQTIISISV